MDNQQNPMDMMQMMMAGGKMPEMMQKCMLTMETMAKAVEKSANLGAYATPELQRLFEEWLDKTSKELLDALEGSQDIEDLSDKMKLSKESINLLLLRLAARGKIRVNVIKA